MDDRNSAGMTGPTPDEPSPPQRKIREKIGLVVVHGIGDQNKNEHLQNVAKHLVKAASIVFGKQNVNVELFPGVENTADLTILIRPGGDEDDSLVAIDVHEMWWKDLGERATPWTVIKFWLWAATFAGTAGRFHPDTEVSVSPGHIWSKIRGLRALQRIAFFFWDRVLLFIKITYFFILLFPLRIAVQLINILPGIRPINLFRTIFSYMSSVQLYQQRRGRTGGTLVDFDQSLRISIQRRFANLLVTVSERNYDRWYVMGHSLGSVISLKGG